MMWRTSWLSREVIVAPALIGTVGLWWLLGAVGVEAREWPLWPIATIVLALLLWYCTAMIYRCIRFIQEWAHPLTVANYALIEAFPAWQRGIGLSWVLVCFAGLCVIAIGFVFRYLPETKELSVEQITEVFEKQAA